MRGKLRGGRVQAGQVCLTSVWLNHPVLDLGPHPCLLSTPGQDSRATSTGKTGPFKIPTPHRSKSKEWVMACPFSAQRKARSERKVTSAAESLPAGGREGA